jgi:hypothetical protein
VDSQTVAATRFALDGIGRGEKVLLIGSRWQYRNILTGLDELVQGFRPHVAKPSWRNRYVSVFEADELQSKLLVDNMPDGIQFASFVRRACEGESGPRPIRVWNTLGSRLHESGNRRAGRAIERLWHEARRHLGCTILGSYPLPDGGRKAAFGPLKKSLASHTHVVRSHQGDLVVDRL